jgi:hypothetical protein
MLSERLDDYINAHPKECLRLLVILGFSIWQTPVAICGIILYVILVKRFATDWRIICLVSIIFALSAFLFHSPYGLFSTGWIVNKYFWNALLIQDIFHCFSSIKISFIIGFSLSLTSLLCLIDLIPDHPYKKEMEALQKGEHLIIPEISDEEAKAALAKFRDEDHDATVLGISKYTGQCVTIPDWYINQVLLVLGTTGSGKTVTLRRFYQRAILKGYPLIIVDGKPDVANIAWLMALAQKHGRKFFGFNCGNYLPYDPLADGGYTELKDKIISLKDEWSSG